jgi:hypothetical protein
MKTNSLGKLIISIAVPELAGIVGSVFTVPSIAGWYAGIVKPALTLYIYRPAHFEHALVGYLFRSSFSCRRFCRARYPLARYSGDDHRFRKNLSACRLASCAIYPLGQFCRISELLDLAAQLTGRRLYKAVSVDILEPCKKQPRVYLYIHQSLSGS